MEPKLAPPNAIAQIAHAVCRHCGKEEFRVLLDVRKHNVKIGSRLGPENTFMWFGIECVACGEQAFRTNITV